MKYDEKLFQLSSEYSEKIEGKECNVDESEEQEFLKFFFEQFPNEVILKEGIVKIIIKNYGREKKAYSFIRNLIESGEFYRFGRKYCFLLGKVEKENVGHNYDSYVEFVWDYQIYFKTFCLNLLEKKGTLKESYPELTKMLENFNELPSKYQMAIVQSFIENIMAITKKHEHELILEKCMREGHQFSKWQKKTQTVYQIVDDNTPSVGPSLGRPIEKNYWERICDRCQYVEKVEEEPPELIAERKEKEEEISKLVNQRKEAKQEILRLERRIKEIKESM